MDLRVRLEDILSSPLWESRPTAATMTAYGIALFFLAYQLLNYYKFPLLSPQELAWNILVYLIPSRLLLASAKRQELRTTGMLSQTHAAKSEAVRRAFGAGGSAIMQSITGADAASRPGGFFSSLRPGSSDAPPGLGNWDNSCYQNSILQGLASLETVKTYLHDETLDARKTGSASTYGALRELLTKLNDPTNNGKQLWTPAKLKSMSSWTQQDAQEYFAKIMDELDKEVAGAKPEAEAEGEPGSQAVSRKEEAGTSEEKDVRKEDDGESDKVATPKNPLEGLLAQRVACTRCGFSEGLSMIPFNCLTVPLGDETVYGIEDCLDEYAKLEEISEVECAKCTLLKAQKHLQSCVGVDSEHTASSEGQKVISLPPALRAISAKRLEAVERALENDDFTDKTLSETCQISKKAHVSSTKTRQAVIDRAPQSLVIHINRSVFDERTGAQRKNHAAVQYPLTLDLAPWVLDHDSKNEPAHASAASSTRSLIAESASNARSPYRLRAVVTHYGRHENGHYIAYRQHPVITRVTSCTPEDGDDQKLDVEETQDQAVQLKWWRLSDDDVDTVSEDEVLRQGGVFMLFYERDDIVRTFPTGPGIVVEPATLPVGEPATLSARDQEEAAAIPLPHEEDDSEVWSTDEDRAILARNDPTSTDVTSPALTEPEHEHEEMSDEPLITEPAAAPAAPSPQSPFLSNPPPEPTEPASIAPVISEQNVGAPPLQPTPTHPQQKASTQPLMRTAHGSETTRRVSKGEKGFGGPHLRPMAAT
nr:ubiquitin carboxyl-terminal hydrolase 1 [Quercus suber]